MNINELLHKYLNESKVMQLATVHDGKPWICSVYFVVDNARNLYWLSLPTRRHSREIMEDHRAAIAIAYKQDMPVIGVQAEGTVEVVSHPGTIHGIMEKYIHKYDAGHEFYGKFISGRAQHRMFKFTPERFVLFDEMHFKDLPQEIRTR